MPLWNLWLACTASPPSETAGPPPFLSSTGPVTVTVPEDLTYLPPVPPDGATPLVTAEPGYAFNDVLFGDVNGDGALDASAQLWSGADGASGIVFGPLVGQALPADFSVRFDYDGWGPQAVVFGELTGAPPVDALYTDAALGTFVVPGPWDGSAAPDPSWIPFADDWFGLVDVDHDGVLDTVDAPAEALEITFGPADRFAGSPDVRVALCRDGSPAYYLWLDYVHAAGDLDGDGDAELSVANFGAYYGVDCGGFTVSVPASGAVDPFAGGDGAMVGVVTSAAPIGDWNGDGLPDLLPGWSGLGWGFYAPPGAADGVLLSPLTFDPFDLGPAQAVPFPPPLSGAHALPFDRNGDGRPELLVRGPSEGDTVSFAVVDSTLQALAFAPALTWTSAWLVGSYVDQGRAVLVFRTMDGAWGLDVGAATPL